MTEKLTLNQRASGVLLHPTSLPGPHGIGDLGAEAFRFADLLQAAGQTWWQMFPLGPLGISHSPYQTLSAFAGNPLLISLDRFCEAGLLRREDLNPVPRFNSSCVDYAAVFNYKEPLLRKAFETFKKKKMGSRRSGYDAFCNHHASWLSDYALFCALKEQYGGLPWTKWPPEVRLGKSSTLAHVQEELKDHVHYYQFLQFEFFQQWAELKRYCNERKIGLIGDIPIFVSPDSADVWAHPELFWLGADGRPTVVAGVPPDYFSRKGQLWGNPLYRWAVLRERGYDWWIDRFRVTFERFDAVRLDHFIGFERYWEIPASSKTAQNGRWEKGPSADFFNKVLHELGPLELIAEDLGVVTPEVIALRDKFNFPGMRVLQFAFKGGSDSNSYLPHNFINRCVVYTGTHDNDTTVGWFKDRGSASSTRSGKEIKRERKRALDYLNSAGKKIHWDMIRLALQSIADTAIVPVQDIIGLGSAARMNLPGTPFGNWKWRMKKNAINKSAVKRLRRLTEIYHRIPKKP